MINYKSRSIIRTSHHIIYWEVRKDEFIGSEVSSRNASAIIFQNEKHSGIFCSVIRPANHYGLFSCEEERRAHQKLNELTVSCQSGQVWGHTPAQRVAASTL